MIGVPFIKSLFSAILAQSKVINGRFYLCPFWGQEINKGNIEEIINWVTPFIVTNQKYPVAMLMPMKEVGMFQYGLEKDGSVQDYSNFECTLVFATNAYVTGQNQPSSPAPGTNQPTHTIPDTWHDMARCAKNFLSVLYEGILAQGLQQTVFISEQEKPQLLPVTNKGNDSISGVLLRFYLKVYPGCTLEDYNNTYLTDIQWPPITDSHPLHLDV